MIINYKKIDNDYISTRKVGIEDYLFVIRISKNKNNKFNLKIYIQDEVNSPTFFQKNNLTLFKAKELTEKIFFDISMWGYE